MLPVIQVLVTALFDPKQKQWQRADCSRFLGESSELGNSALVFEV